MERLLAGLKDVWVLRFTAKITANSPLLQRKINPLPQFSVWMRKHRYHSCNVKRSHIGHLLIRFNGIPFSLAGYRSIIHFSLL